MIKMGVNKDKESKCEECGVGYNYTAVMYNILFIDTKYTICHDCVNTLFQKLLKAECMQNAKLKSKEDMDRISKEKIRKYKKENLN